MMKLIASCWVLVWASTASADAKRDVEALVRTAVQDAAAEANGKEPAASVARTHDTMDVYRTTFSTDPAMNWYGAYASHASHQLGKVTISVDAAKHVGWFHGVVDASYDWTPCPQGGVGKDEKCGPTRREHATWRVSGVAVDEHGWKLAAIMWSRALPDKELLAAADKDAERSGALEAADAPGKTVAGWFGGGKIAADKTSNAVVAASGTAPAEMATGSAVDKLVKGWDALRMWCINVNSKQWANGAIAFVDARVVLPVKPRGGTQMRLGVVLVAEDGHWKWVSLDFMADNP